MHQIVTSASQPLVPDFINESAKHLSTINNKIGMCSGPGRKEPFTLSAGFELSRDLIQDVQNLKDNYRVSILVTLNEEEELITRLGVVDFIPTVRKILPESIHFPIVDMNVPTNMENFSDLVDLIIKQAQEGKIVCVHCREGKGRTGLVVACCLVKLGENPKTAIQIVRKTRKGTIQTFQQEAFVSKYAIFLQKR